MLDVNNPLYYAQSTWTPAFAGSSTPGTGLTYSVQAGSYERTGRLVVARFNIIATSLGTAAGNITITGLPFTNGAELGHAFIPNFQVTGLAASNFGVGGYISAATTVINITQMGNAASIAVTIAQAGGTCFFQGCALYHV